LTSSAPTRAENPRRVPFAVRSVMKGMGARLLVVPVSAGLGVLNTRLIITHFGTDTYAQYGLLTSIGTMLPFADLGMSVALMTAIGASKNPRTDENARLIMITVLRVLAGSAVVLSVISIAIWLAGGWNTILGGGLTTPGGAGAATICLCLIGFTILLGFGQRILIGIHKNHFNVLIVGLQTPVMVLVLLAVTHTGVTDGSYLAVAPYLVMLALNIWICWLAARWVAPLVGRSVRDALRLRTVRGGRVFNVAWPTLIQLVALPIGMQSDRIVLVHASTVTALTQYNLASQMFIPIWGVIIAGGIALWPIYARAQRHGEAYTSPLKLSVGFGVAAGLVALVVGLFAPYLAHLASGGKVHLPVLLIVSFVLFIAVQAMKLPIGYFLTDAKGLAFQAYMILIFLPVNLGLSILFAARLGAAGPIIGSTVGVLGCQVIATWIYVQRRIRSQGAPSLGSLEVTEGAQ
jgi:O-antigen/teichoic acid export membrane protein